MLKDNPWHIHKVEAVLTCHANFALATSVDIWEIKLNVSRQAAWTSQNFANETSILHLKHLKIDLSPIPTQKVASRLAL